MTMLAALRDHRPHVVVVFRPEIVPRGLFADLRVPTLGLLTEPIPRTRATARMPICAAAGRELAGIDRTTSIASSRSTR